MSLWGDSAINAFVNLTPSSPWAIRIAEQWKGLPFGKYLQQSPSARKRALTGPSGPSIDSIWQRLQVFSSADGEPRPYEQPSSSFLSKLPLDIRMIIYEMVLGGKLFHIESGTPYSRIFHVVCSRPEAINETNHMCHDLNGQRPTSAPRDDYHEASGLLPLPVTCRKVYSECIHSLYSANTFQFTSNHAAFRFLKNMIPSHRLQSIRHFRMTMRVPHHPHMNTRSKRDWRALWDFFETEMCGLQRLYLKFLMLHDTQEEIRKADDTEGSAWIEPMILMATSANQVRGCVVEIATGGKVQNLSDIIKVTKVNHSLATRQELLQLACTEVHSKIRLSLGGYG